MQYDKAAYFVYNGKFSKPIIPIVESSFAKRNEIGNLVASSFSDSGFFTIQKVDTKKFQINIQNEMYKEIDGVDLIIKDSYFFDGKNLIFYGMKGMSFYQFKLSL